MSRKLILVRHGNEPDDDRVYRFALMNGFEPVTCRPFQGGRLPKPLRDLAGTVIFGGRPPAENDEDYPYLAGELRWIRECMAAGLAR